MTPTTVGFGDFSPTSDGTQLFTIFYILTGLGILVALLASVAEHYIERWAFTHFGRWRHPAAALESEL